LRVGRGIAWGLLDISIPQVNSAQPAERRQGMGMFDLYLPAGPPTCPIDGISLVNWQGKDGPNALLVWQEGYKHPASQAVSEEVRLSGVELKKFTLPDTFHISSTDCAHFWLATCTTRDGVWSSTEIQVPGRDI
jgi:hypothetical protein